MRTLIVFAVVLVLVTTGSLVRAAESAPDWTLVSPAGEITRLSVEVRKQPVILFFIKSIKGRFVLPELNEKETRIIACLIEKSIVTPELYPMTLNALTNACNQKSSRDPVMSLSQGEVQHTIRALEGKHFVRAEENFKSRTEKYSQRFCGTRYSDFQFDPSQVAIVCLLLLRGPQTPGELKAHSGRLHNFADNSDVVVALDSLIHREGESLVVKLPRTPGRKDSEYMHLFSGPVDTEAYASQALAAKPSAASPHGNVAELTERVERLEAEMAELKALLS